MGRITDDDVPPRLRHLRRRGARVLHDDLRGVATLGGKEWERWNRGIRTRLAHIQRDDGTWRGDHCITSTSFCTAASLVILTVEAKPAPKGEPLRSRSSRRHSVHTVARGVLEMPRAWTVNPRHGWDGLAGQPRLLPFLVGLTRGRDLPRLPTVDAGPGDGNCGGTGRVKYVVLCELPGSVP